jgi:predicted Zn finger-like uncharacterized protein
MYTQCPDCGIAFRVTADVLKQAAGMVRCGGCRSAFNALSFLSESMPKQAAAINTNAAVPELTPEIIETDSSPPRSISAAQSAALLKTLDELAGSDIRIEDTGVEWRVLDDDESSAPANNVNASAADNAASDFDAPLEFAIMSVDEPLDASETPVDEFLTSTPEVIDSPEIFDEDANALGSTPVDELRFDDNTPLPDDFDLDNESSYITPPTPEPVIETQPAPAPRTEFELSAPEEWSDILDEFENVGAEFAALSGVLPATKSSAEEELDEGNIASEIAYEANEILDMDTQFALQAEAMGIDLSGINKLDSEPAEELAEVVEERLNDELEADSIAAAADDEDHCRGEELDEDTIASDLDAVVDAEQDPLSALEVVVDDLFSDLDESVGDELGYEVEEEIEYEVDDGDAGSDEVEDEDNDADSDEVEDEDNDADSDEVEDEDDDADSDEVEDEDDDADSDEVEDEDVAQESDIEIDDNIDIDIDIDNVLEEQFDPVFENHTIEKELASPGDESEQPAQDDENHLPPMTEAEHTVNMQIDQELMALAIEDEDGFASTIIINEEDAEIKAQEELADDFGLSEEPDLGSGFETIIMEGEVIRSALDDQKLATDTAAAAAKLAELARTQEVQQKTHSFGANYKMIGAAAVLGLFLVLQMMHQSREALATTPAFNNTVGKVYRALGQPIQPAWDITGWRFEATTNHTDGGEADELRVYSRIGNESDRSLPYPLIGISLTDRFEETIGSRVLDPAEYLPSGLDPRELVDPGNTFEALITIKSATEAATGFRLKVCYRLSDRQLRCAIDDFK